MTQKNEFLNTKIDVLSNNISEIKKELKENSNFIPKVEQLINKCIKDRIEINNNFMNRQIKALQDQIDSIQKSIDTVAQNVIDNVAQNVIDTSSHNVGNVVGNVAGNVVDDSSISSISSISSAVNDNDNESNSSKKKRGYTRKYDEKVKQLNIE